MSDDAPFDPGLQLERTLLAWRRTTLAVAVVSTAGIRWTTPVIGWPAVVVGAFGLVLAMTAYLATGIRYRQVHRSLANSELLPATAWAQIALAVAVVVLGLVALLYIVVRAQEARID